MDIPAVIKTVEFPVSITGDQLRGIMQQLIGDMLVCNKFYHDQPTYELGHGSYDSSEHVRVVPDLQYPRFYHGAPYSSVLVTSHDWSDLYESMTLSHDSTARRLEAVLAFANSLDEAVRMTVRSGNFPVYEAPPPLEESCSFDYKG